MKIKSFTISHSIFLLLIDETMRLRYNNSFTWTRSCSTTVTKTRRFLLNQRFDYQPKIHKKSSIQQQPKTSAWVMIPVSPASSISAEGLLSFWEVPKVFLPKSHYPHCRQYFDSGLSKTFPKSVEYIQTLSLIAVVNSWKIQPCLYLRVQNTLPKVRWCNYEVSQRSFGLYG